MTELRPGLPRPPRRWAHLPIDERGYPVPYFVSYVNGKPDHRVADRQKIRRAMRLRLCNLCGEGLGKSLSFVIGPMCSVNRTTSEPPCHWECASYAAISCPFMTRPRAKRREANLPANRIDAPGLQLDRNPGVVCIWTTLTFELINVQPGQAPGAVGGTLFRLGEPTHIEWYCEGRAATREDVLDSIRSGEPSLRELADLQGGEAPGYLDEQMKIALSNVESST